jgi:HAMP domain-containing protein/DNA-directed RNA polymerase subunit RPC12/RpoP
MIIICEECGKKYQIDPSRIKTAGAKAKCKACGSMMTISKPETKPVEPPPALRPTREIPAKGDAPPPPREEPPSKGKEEKPEVKEAVPKAKKKGMGLRFKIFILFFLVPIILFVGAGYLYLWQLENLSALITEESSKAVTQLGEQIIAEKARSVASQVRLYLMSRPDLKKEGFSADPEFTKLAVQKVGLTGYTALHGVPDNQGIWRNWAHTNPKIVGLDMSTLKGPMGNNFPGFWKVFSNGKDGKESSGYYKWQEPDGSFRDKYMVCAPVQGTPYYVAATTYLDEFTKPVKEMEAKAIAISTNTRNIVLGILGGTLLLIGIIVALYGTRLTSRIKKLTSVAEQISVGEMDAEIPVTSRDEIGDLAEAIGRMQESIRLSIERLRRRR